MVKGSTSVAYKGSHVVNQLDKSSVFKKLNDEFAISGMETKGIHYLLCNVPQYNMHYALILADDCLLVYS